MCAGWLGRGQLLTHHCAFGGIHMAIRAALACVRDELPACLAAVLCSVPCRRVLLLPSTLLLLPLIVCLYFVLVAGQTRGSAKSHNKRGLLSKVTLISHSGIHDCKLVVHCVIKSSKLQQPYNEQCMCEGAACTSTIAPHASFLFDCACSPACRPS